MQRTTLFLVAVLFAAVPAASAPAPSALDGPVQWYGPGPEPVIELPIENGTVPNFFAAINRFAHIPYGIEYSRHPLPFAPRPNPITTPTYVRFGDMTVRQALDTLVQLDPRYLWRDLDGVPVLRPVTAWADPHHFLNRSIGTVKYKSTTPQQMVGRILGWLYERPPIYRGLQFSGDGFPLEVKAGTVLMALVATVKADGDIYWDIRYRKLTGRYRRRVGHQWWFSLGFGPLDRSSGFRGNGQGRDGLPPPWNGSTAKGTP